MDHFIVTKYNGTCKSSPDFHRCIIRLKSAKTPDTYYQYCIIQYLFDKEEHDFVVTCHGYKKRATAHKQTAQSVCDNLRVALTGCTPKEAINNVRRKSGR